ncbi:MAG: 50S ribosomal protein L29 [Candidatus Bathyarchaeia archaeon]
MAILRMKEVRGLNPAERSQKVSELRVELMKLRTAVKAGGKVENPGRIREIRRVIARLLTAQAQEE